MLEGSAAGEATAWYVRGPGVREAEGGCGIMYMRCRRAPCPAPTLQM